LLSTNLLLKDFFPKYPKKKTLSTLRISDFGFELAELDSAVEITNPHSEIPNEKGRLPVLCLR